MRQPKPITEEEFAEEEFNIELEMAVQNTRRLQWEHKNNQHQ